MSRTAKGNTRVNDTWRANYLLHTLKMDLTTEITTTGTTLALKIIKMGGSSYKFMEVYTDGKCVGRIDPFTLLSLCETTTFFTVSDYLFREKIGAMLHIAQPDKISVTVELLKRMIKFKLLTGYLECNYKEQYGVELSSTLIQIFE